MASLSREIPLGKKVAVLVIDAQNYCWVKGRGIWAGAEEAGAPSDYYWESVSAATCKIAAILKAARFGNRAERVFTVIEALTSDGRDLSLDYKISKLGVSKGSWEAQVVEGLAPVGDEIVLPKGSSSVFCSTNASYILRNLGVEQLVVVGGLTDQCVESAVRDACDEGFLVTLVTDACVTHSAERHANSLEAVKGYCRRRTAAEVVAELSGAARGAPSAARRALAAAGEGPVYVRFEVVDLNGKALNKTVPSKHAFDGVYMYSGALAMGADSRILTFPTCVGDAGCPNWKLAPDWSTLQRLPWASSSTRTVFRVYCDVLKHSVAPLGACPRVACRSALGALEEAHGLRVLAASELEFVVFKGDAPHFGGVDIFSTLQFVKTEDLAYAIAEDMAEVDVDVRTLNTEYGDGQLEITFSPKFGVAAGDDASTFKTGVKELAYRRGLAATFSSKPFGGPRGVGNGGHFNFSLWRSEDEPATHAADDETGLCATAKHFLAGVLAHARGIEALAAPTPGCYARHGNWAPTKADWGKDDRTACVRVKADPQGAPDAAYFEYRAPSAAANAYLVLAGLAAAGADGIDRKLQLPGPKDPDAPKLPTSLPEALDALKADTVLAAVLGDDFLAWFDGVKRAEVAFVDRSIERFRADGDAEDVAIQKAWNDLYFQFV